MKKKGFEAEKVSEISCGCKPDCRNPVYRAPSQTILRSTQLMGREEGICRFSENQLMTADRQGLVAYPSAALE